MRFVFALEMLTRQIRWLAMRVFEVGDLSDDTIRSYLRAMFREALSRHKPIHGITAEEAKISSVTSHIVQ